MDNNALERPATSEDAERLARAGYLTSAGLERAYILVGKTPGPAVWARFIDWMLLALGTLLALAGVIFLAAYNWDAIPHLVKLGVVAALILLCIGVSTTRGLDTRVGKATLMGAAILVGALFAIFGQAYQTGADSFELFFTWALLIVPWTVVSMWTPMWLLLLVLLNLSLGLFWNQRLIYDSSALYTTLGLMNIAWLCAWEYSIREGARWMQGRWFPQLIGTVAFGLLLIPTVEWIVSTYAFQQPGNLVGAIVYGALCVLTIGYYRLNRDLFLLSVCALSLVIIVTAIGTRLLEDGLGITSGSNWFILSAVVIGATSIAVGVLRRTARSWERTAS